MTNPILASSIHIHGAKENNLKNITVDIPLRKLSVVTGVSGSGKSSLVMDVLYAEAQRKFAESMTSYARQFLANSKKPQVDHIAGLCPAISISQRKFATGSRSTVGTVTETYDYLRVLYARLGKIISPTSQKEIFSHQAIDIAEELINDFLGHKIWLTFSIQVAQTATQRKEQLDILQRKGLTRMYDSLTHTVVDSEQSQASLVDNEEKFETWFVLFDRLMISAEKSEKMRLVDSLQNALFEGNNHVTIFFEGGEKKVYSTLLEENGITYLSPSPELFSFNNSYGICQQCEGYGTVLDVDTQLVIPDTSKSLYDGAVVAWSGEKMNNYLHYFIDQSACYKFPIHKPIRELTKEQLHLLWNGNHEVQGIYDFFDEVKKNTYKIQYRVLLSRYQGKTKCRACEGYRLRKEALCVKWQGKHIGELTALPILALKKHLQSISLTESEEKVSKRLLAEIHQRLDTLIQLGLSYLSLHRPMSTLSGGESQRVHLARFIGSNLTDSIYILDEPSIGLHEKDTLHLIKVLYKLRDLGNTVVVVEHDEHIIRAADHIIDMGPMAGEHGGNVVAEGDLATIMQKNTLTAKYLNHSLRITRKRKINKQQERIRLEGASLHNLDRVDIQFPIQSLTVVHGPSGAGKSSLISKILYPAICKQLECECEVDAEGDYLHIKTPSGIAQVEWISQHAITRLSRSNAISYIGAYDEIRKLFAGLEDSKRNFFTAGTFSFNSAGGRCEECKGEGIKTIEMQFLPAVVLECEVCRGKKFTEEVLAVTLNGKNIYQVLDLTVEESLVFFKKYKKVVSKLEALFKVGLSYIRLGQSTTTLSGGELQRLKLASFLCIHHPKPTLFFFDEPTIGLHFDDVQRLVNIFDEIVAQGHTVLVIEHNPDLIKCADWLIELGPESGERGGKIVYCGSNNIVIK